MQNLNHLITDSKILQLAGQHLYSSENIFGTLDFARAIVRALTVPYERLEELDRLAALCASQSVSEPDTELALPISEFLDQLDLPVRMRNALLAELSSVENQADTGKITTLGEFLKFSREELLLWPNLGRRSLNELEEILRNRGLHLRKD